LTSISLEEDEKKGAKPEEGKDEGRRKKKGWKGTGVVGRVVERKGSFGGPIVHDQKLPGKEGKLRANRSGVKGR